VPGAIPKVFRQAWRAVIRHPHRLPDPARMCERIAAVLCGSWFAAGAHRDGVTYRIILNVWVSFARGSSPKKVARS
jgi:hypothetical protein